MEIKVENNVESVFADCNTLDDLQAAFTLDDLATSARDGLLTQWLRAHFFTGEAMRIEDEMRHLTRDRLLILLCDVLNIDIGHLSDYEMKLVTDAVKRERDYAEMKAECFTDGEDGVIVQNQAELIRVLRDESIVKVYLYGETFSIPLDRKNITYVGRKNALVNITVMGDMILSFDENKIYFYDLTLVVHYLAPEQVEIEHSKNNGNHIVFLRANAIQMNGSVTATDIGRFLAGRKPFESPQSYAKRAEDFRGIVVGKVCLKNVDYDFYQGVFYLRPTWRVEYAGVLQTFLWGAEFCFSVSPSEAEWLYLNDRAQLVYADFFSDKDNAAIARLYLQTNNGKVYLIYVLHPETKRGLSNISCSGSGSSGAGYGLDLIAYDTTMRSESNTVSYG